MPNNDLPIVSQNDQDDVTDLDPAEMEAFGRVLSQALAKPAIPSVSEETRCLESRITEVDRRAISVLGTAEVFVRGALSQIQLNESEAQSFIDTHRDTASKRTVPEKPREPKEPSPDFVKLTDRHRAFRNLHYVRWSCEYKKVKRIGRGGQGVVHLLENDFGEQRAMKILSPDPYDGDADAYFNDMQRMAELAAITPKRHDNLLEVEHFNQHDGFMIMKLIDGFDLDRIMQPEMMALLKRHVSAERWAFLSANVFTKRETGDWALMPGVAVMIAEKILRGLSALHERELVHADVKPSNCMLDAYGSIRLIDIGSAFKTSQPCAQPLWTPRYASPEVLEGQPSTFKSDLASVGYMLIELISGRPGLIDPPVGWNSVRTFDAKKRLALAKAKRELFNRLHELIPERDLSCRQLMDLFRMLIHPDPEKRFDNLDDALKQTDSFRNVLVQGGMSLNWCQVFKFWVRDVQAALASLG